MWKEQFIFLFDIMKVNLLKFSSVDPFQIMRDGKFLEFNILYLVFSIQTQYSVFNIQYSIFSIDIHCSVFSIY